jgi:hypothetical protein
MRMLGLISFIALCGFSQAAPLQLMSAKEATPGAVTATVGVHVAGTPKPSEFLLRFDQTNAFQAREVKQASSSALETSVILCIDQSGSMGYGGVKQVQEAIRSSVTKKLGDGRLNVALWAFDTDVTKLRGFSTNMEELSKTAGEIGIRAARDNKTKLYEAIELALAELRNYPKVGPKRLILVTDGKDDGSSITEQVVVNEANAQSVIIDAIGFGKISDQDANLLARLAKSTDGYFIRATSSDELSRELRKLLSLPPPRVFEVNFQYSASASSPKSSTAQLEFAAAGQPPALLNIQHPLSTPQPVPSERKESKQGEDKKFDLSILLWILIGLIAIVGVYLLGRGKKKEEVKHEITAVPELKPAPVDSEPSPEKRPRTMVAFMFPSPQKGQPAAYLEGITGKARGSQYRIEQKETRIGAGDDNDLRVEDEFVSRKHATIRYDSGGLYLSDKGSRNGTFLNDAQLHLSAMALTPGDQIRVGKTVFRVKAPDDDRAPRHAPQHPEKAPGGETYVP